MLLDDFLGRRGDQRGAAGLASPGYLNSKVSAHSPVEQVEEVVTE